MPEVYKDADQIDWTRALPTDGVYSMVKGNGNANGNPRGDPDLGEEIRKLEEKEGMAVEDGEDEERRIEGAGAGQGGKRGTGSPEAPKLRIKRSVSWGETKIMGEDGMGQEVGGSEGESGK